MKILKIVKLNWFERFMSINHWNVQVEYDDGTTDWFQCWAGTKEPSTSRLLSDLKNQIQQKNASDDDIAGLEGRTI